MIRTNCLCIKRLLFLLFLSFCLNISAQDLESGFKNPPESAKPRTWWHWTNSNITKEGITKDVEWMKRIGIGGMQLADVASGQGQTVEKKILFGSPEWLDAVHHAAAEADRLGLEMAIFSSPGWSLTGGPWVKPEQAMKKLVWSLTDVKGPADLTIKLPSPPDNEGPIRDFSRSARISDSDPHFYKDCIVLAFPAPPDETDISRLISSVTTSGGVINPAALLDDNLNSATAIRSGKDRDIVWLQYNFDQPVKAKAITIASRAGIPVGFVKAGDDLNALKIIAVLPGAQLYRAGKVETFSFPEVSSKIFRIEFTGAPMRPNDVMAETPTRPDSVYTINELKLHAGARINRWEDKAGFYHLFSYEPVASNDVPDISAIPAESVTNISKYMSPDGTVRWKVPAGNWTIMRFGYSLTGSTNRPAVRTGSGYEVDKLSREHTAAYIKDYTEPIARELGPLFGKSLTAVMLDSWEAGMQNWTDSMLTEFRKRRGYDLSPYLPCLSGRVVGSGTISDRVLWDFRRTLADMFAENHYKVLTDYLNRQGLKTYGEASGVSLEILEDALLCKKYVDYPMGEFWYRPLHPALMYYQDIRGAASASHVYDKNIVAAEAYTGGGFESPYTLKKIGDYWFAQGVNRFVFHTSAHQPLDTKPGNTMVGTHINRNITWAEQAAPFMNYLSRNSYMLQQGKFVADIAYLLNEGAPSTMPIWGSGLNPAPPDGYDYDYINADVLVNRMKVSPDGKLVLPDGMSYSVLVLPETKFMTIPVLDKIKELVLNGATVIGPKPEHTPGLTGFPESEEILRADVNELWGDLDGISRTRRIAGKGLIVWGAPLQTVLEMKGIAHDLQYDRLLGKNISWIHRKTGESDIYFVVNSSDGPQKLNFSFRTSGNEAEIWDPSDGSTRKTAYEMSQNRTVVPLDLEERQSVFVVFRNKTSVTSVKAQPEPAPAAVSELTGDWEVSFPPDAGAPAKITMDTLRSLTLSTDDGVKYFSGTATYSKTFNVQKSMLQGKGKVILDLGKVGDIAEVEVNGTQAGTLWKAPYVADITGLLRKGENRIAVRVTNEWTNRLAGDRITGKKVLNSTLFVRPGFLPESGLMGPVRLIKY